MTPQPAAPFPPLSNEDSASNQGSSVAGDYFDDDSSSLFDRDKCSPSNTGSLADDSDDEDYSWITPVDMAILRTFNSGLEVKVDSRRHYDDESDTSGGIRMYPFSKKYSLQPQLSQFSRLPRGTVPVRLVGEGAANAVFQIKVPANCRPGSHLKGSLLRVAKVPKYDYLRQQKFFNTSIKPILGDHAVRQELVILQNSGIVDQVNAILQNIDHRRKPKFRGSLAGQAAWGFLVEDMLPNDKDYVLIEFKPKWLSQSPSAPANAIRCRQCALDFRNFVRDPSKKPCPTSKPCPLTLGNPLAPRQVSSPFRIAPQLAGLGADEHFEEALARVANHESIHRLRAEQQRLDRLGPLRADVSDPMFIQAMTIRDCTCFALIPKQGSGPIKIRLGDFDWKDPEVKLNHWRGTEQDLITGGFYTAEWILCDGEYYHPPTLCQLEWTGGRRSASPDIVWMTGKNQNDVTKAPGPNASDAQPSPAARLYRHRTTCVNSVRQTLQGFRRKTDPMPYDIIQNPFRSDPS